MKKYLLLAALAAATMTAQGANFEVGYSRGDYDPAKPYTNIINGEEINIWGAIDVDEGYVYEIPMYLCIANTSGQTINLTVNLCCDDDQTSMTAGAISFCVLGNCREIWSAEAEAAPGQEYSGVGEHIIYTIGSSDSPTPVDINSDDYCGVWVGDLTVSDGVDKVGCTIYFSRDDLGFDSLHSIHVDGSDATPVYYNLQGQPVSNPAGGLYIERRGQTSRKVML